MSLLEKYGLKPGDPVPLHIANAIRKDQARTAQDNAKAAGDLAGEAVAAVLNPEIDEKPRSGRRPRKNLRAPVKTPKGDDE